MKELFQNIMTQLDASSGLTAAYLIVCGLIIVMSIVCVVLEIRVWLRYRKANKMAISTEMSGVDAARYVLDRAGLQHVKVRKAGFLREMLFGNYYNIATKTIYLRSVFGKIDNKQTVTSMALGVQKAAVARLCEEGDKQARVRNRLSLIGVFGPLLFIPVILIGMIVDLLVMNSVTMISYVSFAVGILLALAGFIVTMLNIPVEKRANRLALQMMEEYGMADGEELETMRGVYDAYILSYIAQFILEILRVIQLVLEIVIKAKKSNN